MRYESREFTVHYDSSDGVCLERGAGIATNVSEAAKALYALSRSAPRCLENGTGIPVKLPEAGRDYKLSTDQANALGQHEYGRSLQKGTGIAKDDSDPVRYFRLSDVSLSTLWDRTGTGIVWSTALQLERMKSKS
jgi:hypothetical protein